MKTDWLSRRGQRNHQSRPAIMRFQVSFLFALLVLSHAAARGRQEASPGGTDDLWTIEEKTGEFFQALHEKQFDRLLAMASGEIKTQLAALADASRNDPAAAARQIPDRWKIFGADRDPRNGYFCYVHFRFDEAWSRAKLFWHYEAGVWIAEKLQPVIPYKISPAGAMEKTEEPLVTLHLSAAEEAGIREGASRLMSALENWQTGEIAKLLPFRMREDFLRHMADPEREGKMRQQYAGTLIHIESIRSGREWDSKDGKIALIELYVEHKSGSGDFLCTWELRKTDGRWSVTNFQEGTVPGQ